MQNLKEARSSIATGLLVEIFAVLFYWETYHFHLVKNINTVNAAFMPRILSVLVFLCATSLVLQGLRTLRQIPPEQRKSSAEERRRSRAGLLRIGQVFAVLLAAAAAFKTLVSC